MSINGQEAVKYLAGITNRVSLHRKDNTDKLWSYKLKTAKKTEFAFDPKTITGLFVRVDRKPPVITGVSDIRSLSGKNVSTALGRVFSGGDHKARFYAKIESVEALNAFIAYYEAL